MESSIELLSSRSAGLSVQEHEGLCHKNSTVWLMNWEIYFQNIAAMELKKLPAKKKLLSQLKQQNAIQNQLPPSSISVIPLNNSQAHTTATKMDQDEDEIVHDDDSPLDMRITKQQDSDELRPSVIRKRKRAREISKQRKS